MASIDEALLGPAPTAADIPAIADALRRRRTMGVVGMASGLPNLAEVGKGMTDEADQYGQDLQNTRQHDNFLQETKDRSAQQESQFARDLAETIRSHNMQDSRQRDIAKIAASAHGSHDLTEEETKALDEAVIAGKVDPRRINSRTGKFLAQAFMMDPTQDLNRLTSDAAMMANPQAINRANVVEQLPTVMKNMVEAGKEVGLSNFKPIGILQAWGKSQRNDPKYTKYMAQRNDALMTIASAMRGVGMSDQAHQAEIEAAAGTMSPRALEGWLAGQMEALMPRLKQAQKYTRENSAGGPVPFTTPPMGSGASSGGYADPEKEARYQEYLKANGG